MVPLAAVQAGASAVQAVAGVVNSIAGISDMNKRRLYEQNLGLLNLDQKAKLDQLLRSAKSEEARQAILAQTLSTANSARIDALAKVQAEKEKTKKTVLVVSIVGGIVLLGGLLLILAKRKK